MGILHVPGWVSALSTLLRSYWSASGRQALANLVGLALCTALSQLAMLVVLFVLTRELGPEGFGSVVFALSVQMVLCTLGTAGLLSVVVRDLTAHAEQADQTTTSYFAITGSVSVLVGILAVLVFSLLPLSGSEKVLLSLVAAGNVAVCLSPAPLFDARHRQALSAVLALIGDATAVAGVLTAVFLDELSLPLVGVILLARWSITLAAQAWVYHRCVYPLAWRWSRERALAMMRSGLPLLVASAVALVPLNGSVVLVRVIRGERETALHGLALQIGTVYLLGGLLGQRVLQPHISGPHGLERSFVVKLALFSGAFLGGLWLAGVALSWATVCIVLDAPYRPAFGPCVVVLSAALIYSVGGIAALYLVRFGKERAVQGAYLIGAIAYAATAGLLVSRLPLMGVSLLTLGAAVVVTGILLGSVFVAWPGRR